MKPLKYFGVLFSTLILSIFTASCSDDQEDELIQKDESSISFNVSGAVEGEKSGIASMGQLEVGGSHQLRIRGNDGDEETDQSYILDFLIGPQSSQFSAPEPGTYDISTLIEAAGSGYYVSYVDQPFGNSREFGGAEASGELVITNVTDDFIEGTFSFTAKSNATEEQIQVTNGVFKANNSL